MRRVSPLLLLSFLALRSYLPRFGDIRTQAARRLYKCVSPSRKYADSYFSEFSPTQLSEALSNTPTKNKPVKEQKQHKKHNRKKPLIYEFSQPPS
jgi:hypothetical protein